MSQNYRQDSRHTYNPRSSENQRQPNRSSYYSSSSYKQPQNNRPQYRNDNYKDSQNYRNNQSGNYESAHYRTGSQYKSSSSGYYNNRDSKYQYKYSRQYKDDYKERQQRSYSKDVHPYKYHQNRYDRNYESKYEKRSRSRSRNKEHYRDQQIKNYGIKNEGYQRKDYNRQSYSSYNKYQKPINQSSSKNIEIDNHNKKQIKISNYLPPPIIISSKQNLEERKKSENYPRTQKESSNKYESQSYKRNEPKIFVIENQRYENKQFSSIKQKRDSQPKNFISIEVKSRQRSPISKDKKSRNSHSSQSKSRSKSRRSKQESKRKHSKKHKPSKSSSHSSSYSSSSSSSSSNRSSSSSSSRSSSQSFSQSQDSRKHKNKISYHRNSSQQRYPTESNYNSERLDQKYQTKKSYETSNLMVNQVEIGERKSERSERQNLVKQVRDQKLVTSNQKLIQQNKAYNKEVKEIKKYEVEISQSLKPKLQRQSYPIIEQPSYSSNKLPQTQINQQRISQGGDSFRKYQPGNRYPNQSYHQNYQGSRQYFNYNQFQNQQNQNQNQNQQSSIIKPSQSLNSSIDHTNLEINPPSYPQRIYSNDNPKIPFGGENDYQKRNLNNQPFRKPYVNAYQNYPPPPSTNFTPLPYQSNYGNPPYQKYNQGFNTNRTYEKSLYPNKNYQQQQNLQTANNFNSPQSQFFNQNQLHYQSNFQPQMRRVNSEMVGQRRNSYFQPTPQSNQNQLIKNQINKFQTEKQDLALIQKAFKRQSSLKKIKQLIPCSKVLSLIEKTRQNLSIPAIKPNFLILDLFREMNDFKKENMNSNLRSILQQDFDKRYNQEKQKVFQNLRVLNLDENRPKQSQQNNPQIQNTKEVTALQCQKHNTQKMDSQNNENPEQAQRPHQFIWKKPQISQNFRQLKSNIDMLRKASTSLSQISRKIKIKEFAN